MYVCVYIPLLLDSVLPDFSHDRPKRPSPSFSSATFQNFPGISDLLSKVSTFQHHTMLCLLLLNAVFPMPVLSLISLVRTSCIICYHSTQIVDIFHILLLFLFCHNLFCRWLSSDSHFLFFPTFSFHSILQFPSVYQSCPVATFLP